MNTEMFFECEVDSLDYSIIEDRIARYFDMGDPNSSGLPISLPEESQGTYTLSCTLKSGTFRIATYKLKNAKFLLSVRLIGSLKKSK